MNFSSAMGAYCRRFGLLNGLQLYYQTKPRPRETRIELPELAHPVYLRTGLSDRAIFREVFVEQDYAIPLRKEPQTILDVGGNVGLTAIYFANRFPEAQIYSLEPDGTNFKQLKKNVAFYPNVIPMPYGLWSRDCRLDILSEPNPAAIELRESDADGAIVGRGLSSLVSELGIKHIDLLKMDVEGAESEILTRGDLSWVDRVGSIVVEFHGDKVDARQLIGLIEQRGFSSEQYGLNYLFQR